MPCGNQAADGQHQSSKGEKFRDLRVAIVRLHKKSMMTNMRGEWKSKIEDASGQQVHAKIKKDTKCLVVSGVLDDKFVEMNAARFDVIGCPIWLLNAYRTHMDYISDSRATSAQ